LPRLVSTGCHGDLNAGNILFQPGPNASYPLFIDFGEMHGNPTSGYPSHGHPPFWDFAKLERDIKTRLFLQEARAEGLSLEVIVAALQHLDRFSCAASLPADLAALPAVQRLATTLNALRDAVQHSFSPPTTFQAWYRISVASATLRVLYRSPDAGIDPAIQQRAAAESVLALLTPASSTTPPAASASSHPPETLSTSSSGALPSKPPTLLVHSFASQPASPPHDPALLLDLTDLFHDRDPLHDQVWAEAIPQRIAAILPAIKGLPQPLRLSLVCHLSIAWYLGTQLNPKPRPLAGECPDPRCPAPGAAAPPTPAPSLRRLPRGLRLPARPAGRRPGPHHRLRIRLQPPQPPLSARHGQLTVAIRQGLWLSAT
jgi:hypothetical protein